MKILYLDVTRGAAGDMLASSLLSLLPDTDGVVRALNAANLPVVFKAETLTASGVSGLHLSAIPAKEERCHGGMEMISHTVSSLAVADTVKEKILGVYGILAEAEGKVHGVPAGEVHFHEIGRPAAIASVAAFCMIEDAIDPDRIVATPVRTGFGKVRCAHGVLDVPTPATAEILNGMPYFAGEVEGELCTPTGAAIVKYFADEYAEMPPDGAGFSGIGMGTKKLPEPGYVRAILTERPGC